MAKFLVTDVTKLKKYGFKYDEVLGGDVCGLLVRYKNDDTIALCCDIETDFEADLVRTNNKIKRMLDDGVIVETNSGRKRPEVGEIWEEPIFHIPVEVTKIDNGWMFFKIDESASRKVQDSRYCRVSWFMQKFKKVGKRSEW